MGDFWNHGTFVTAVLLILCCIHIEACGRILLNLNWWCILLALDQGRISKCKRIRKLVHLRSFLVDFNGVSVFADVAQRHIKLGIMNF